MRREAQAQAAKRIVLQARRLRSSERLPPMGYLPPVTFETRGIHVIEPMRYRSFDGLCSIFWEARAEAGARGSYSSPDPRITLFFDDISAHAEMADTEAELAHAPRPMLRALYLPAGVSIVTRFRAAHRFAHLDLHLHPDWALGLLRPSLGHTAATEALRHTVALQDVAALEPLGKLLTEELRQPAHHALFSETLVASMVAGLLDLAPKPATEAAAPVKTPLAQTTFPRAQGGLTPAQMRAITARVDAADGRRLTLAELAETVGLSESWFSAAFKATTGQTSLQWQQERRIEWVKRLIRPREGANGLSLVEVAARLGFADQAHLTRVFRQITGETPTQWRRNARLE